MTKKTRAKARRALLTLSLVLVMMMVAVGGTIAWLTDSTEEVVNTFSPTTINIDLDEDSEQEFDMIPGAVYTKDPYVTVEQGSEKCHIFVEVTASATLSTFVDYSVADTWDQVEVNGNTIVYHYETVVDASAADVKLPILTGNTVTIKDVTKAQLDGLNSQDLTLEFVAYAVQADNLGEKTVAQIWELAK